jgi:hypothetical protein
VLCWLIAAANAIFIGYARDVELSHNTISNTSYSAICIGGGWPKKPSYGKNVRVVYNQIKNFMQLLADGTSARTRVVLPFTTSGMAHHTGCPWHQR